MQERRNSIANALELRLSCTNPSSNILYWKAVTTVHQQWSCFSYGIITDITTNIREHFVNAPSQWETTLHCNVVFNWLGACTKWILNMMINMHEYYTYLLCWLYIGIVLIHPRYIQFHSIRPIAMFSFLLKASLNSPYMRYHPRLWYILFWDVSLVVVVSHCPQHFENETKWLAVCRWHFKMQFLQ